MATKVTTIPTPLTVTDLDFDSILYNFREYMKSQDTWKDYNFEGSAITELLKILSYNTFYNSFYVNNIANEMYLDTASERSAVVSRAKAIAYVPASQKSSYMYVDLEAKINKVVGESTPTSSSFITLMPYGKFTSSVQDQDYQFLTTEQNNLYYTGDGGDYWIYKKKNVKIVEGKAYSFSWKVQNDYDKYIIPNAGVDIDTLIVRVFEDSFSVNYDTFTKVDNITNVSSDDNVYWIYEGEDQKFYIEFGNGSYGKKLDIGNVIYIEYIIGNGAKANGSRTFDINIGDYQYSDTTITEAEALTVTNSNYTILTLTNVTSDFTTNTLVRGVSSNNTAYVYSYDATNFILKLYSSDSSFSSGETIREETTVSGQTVIGSQAIITSINSMSSVSTGGADIESIESIKFNAPKFYTAQDRLVTARDYETVIKNSYPFIDSIKCWGGEDEVPEQLGKVFVSIKPKSREALDVWEKEYITTNIIDTKSYIGVTTELVDPQIIYLHLQVEIKYDSNLDSSTTKESIINDVKNNINEYNNKNLNAFNKNFYYSKFSTVIDDSNDYIISNVSYITLLNKFKPLLNTNSNTSINYGTIIDQYGGYDFLLKSSDFSCKVGVTEHDNCHFEAIDTTVVVKDDTSSTIVNNAGHIDYLNGLVYFSNVTITGTELYDSSNTSIINVYVNPYPYDVFVSKNTILSMDSDMDITMTPISSL